MTSKPEQCGGDNPNAGELAAFLRDMSKQNVAHPYGGVICQAASMLESQTETLDSAETVIESLLVVNKREWQRAEKAEAQAARYRKALELMSSRVLLKPEQYSPDTDVSNFVD